MKMYKSITKILAMGIILSLATLTLGQQGIHTLKDCATKTSSGLGSGLAKTLVRPCIDQIATQATTTKKSLVLKSFSFLKNATLNYYRFLGNRLTNIGSGLKGLVNITRGKDFGSDWTSKNAIDAFFSSLSIIAITYGVMKLIKNKKELQRLKKEKDKQIMDTGAAFMKQIKDPIPYPSYYYKEEEEKPVIDGSGTTRPHLLNEDIEKQETEETAAKIIKQRQQKQRLEEKNRRLKQKESTLKENIATLQEDLAQLQEQVILKQLEREQILKRQEQEQELQEQDEQEEIKLQTFEEVADPLRRRPGLLDKDIEQIEFLEETAKTITKTTKEIRRLSVENRNLEEDISLLEENIAILKGKLAQRQEQQKQNFTQDYEIALSKLSSDAPAEDNYQAIVTAGENLIEQAETLYQHETRVHREEREQQRALHKQKRLKKEIKKKLTELTRKREQQQKRLKSRQQREAARLRDIREATLANKRRRSGRRPTK